MSTLTMLIQAVEAIGVGIVAAVTAHSVTGCGWWDCAIAAGIAAAVGKVMPKQIIPTGPAPKS